MEQMFDKETTAKLINLAMAIDVGEVSCKDALITLSEYPSETSAAIILFWMRFNDMTSHVVDKLVECKTKMQVDFLERCLEKECEVKHE